MAVSEIGVSFSDKSFGKESRIGNVFTYVIRELMQFDKTLDQSITRLQTAHRTCDLLFGVGDGKPGIETFRGFELSEAVCNVYDDKNLKPDEDWH